MTIDLVKLATLQIFDNIPHTTVRQQAPNSKLSAVIVTPIADLVGWVKERNPTMRNDNLIVELLLSLSLTK
jgi:hypothetical protein